MSFVTYENTNNPHVAIHREDCSHINKHGGVHRDGKEHYHYHESYNEAVRYAETLKLELKVCSTCNPDM